MRIDYDLIRDLLLKVEEWSTSTSCVKYEDFPRQHEFTNEDEVVYHLRYLWRAGYLVADATYLYDLSPVGVAYLETIRDESTWVRIKDKATRVMNRVPITILQELALDFVRSSVGL